MKLIRIVLICLTLFFLFIKLFLVQINLADSPESFLVLKNTPAFTSYIAFADYPLEDHIILQGENGYFGDGFYFHVVTWLWIVVPLSFACTYINPKMISKVIKSIRGKSIIKLKYVAVVCVICNVLCLSGLFFRILMIPGNYTGFNILYLLFIPGLTFVAGILVFFMDKKNILPASIVIVFALFTALVIILLYHFNILIPYEIWLKRGMPDPRF
ncbi:MAG: hypothetical protein JXJ04_06905 [Spirochaetales bacterium]|nr:hypothetical protein [Spirochaetales bacterium]